MRRAGDDAPCRVVSGYAGRPGKVDDTEETSHHPRKLSFTIKPAYCVHAFLLVLLILWCSICCAMLFFRRSGDHALSWSCRAEDKQSRTLPYSLAFGFFALVWPIGTQRKLNCYPERTTSDFTEHTPQCLTALFQCK